MRASPKIERLNWDDWNREHVSKHSVRENEVDEVIASRPVIRESYKSRYIATGRTPAGRVLTVVVGEDPVHKGLFYLFSARPASRKERRIHEQEIGGSRTMTKLKPSIDFGYPTEAHGRIPAFQDIEEEAEFWDTHDLSEFYGVELLPVEVEVGGELASQLTIDLDLADREALSKCSRDVGVGPSTLARIWIMERLRQEDEAERALQKTG